MFGVFDFWAPGAWLASQAQASHIPAEMTHFSCLIQLAHISLAQPIF
jgi:hypothetical protein